MCILPSILSGNWSNFEKEVSLCEKAGATQLHFDVMDGNFVPSLTFGPKFIKDIRSKTKLFIDVHLMVLHPQQYIQEMAKAGADMFTFHIEADQYSFRCIQAIRDAHMKVGIALNPQTPLSHLNAILGLVDLVLVMTVEPGFGGQVFIESMYEKITELSHIRSAENLNFLISVDGGINENNALKLQAMGVDWFVMGSSFFSQKNKKKFLESLSTH